MSRSLAAGDTATAGKGVAGGVYLDSNATTRPLEAVVEYVADGMRQTYANPSSAHWLGSMARSCLEQARDDVCRLVSGVLPEGAIFTSGGTEGNNTILTPRGEGALQSLLITSNVEHASVLRPAAEFARRGGRVVFLEVSPEGLVDPAEVGRVARSASAPIVLSVQWANGETGVVQPVREIAAEARRAPHPVFFHSDVAQAIGRVSIDLDAADIDAATFSGHKLHGPQGTGALLLREPRDASAHPLILGGGQERGFRAGTQNVAGLSGLGLAARLRAEAFADATAHMQALRDEFEAILADRIPGIRVNGTGAPRVPNTSNIRFPGVEAMVLVARLDAQGIACSMGSACSAGKPEPSHVLMAMGMPEQQAFSSVRFSFSILNTMDEAGLAARVIADTFRAMVR